MCEHDSSRSRDLKETIEQAEQKIRQKKLGLEEVSDSPGPAKKEPEGQPEKETTKRSSLIEMKKAVRNGDMFTEEKNMFEEKYLVSLHTLPLPYVYTKCVTLLLL